MLIKETDRTIKQVRSELRDWGSFWKNRTDGGIGTSLMDAFIQSQRSQTNYDKRLGRLTKAGEARSNKAQGVELPFDATATQTRVPVSNNKEVFVPLSLRELDDFIETLDRKLRVPLMEMYIKNKDSQGFWLDRAEKEVMLR